MAQWDLDQLRWDDEEVTSIARGAERRSRLVRPKRYADLERLPDDSAEWVIPIPFIPRSVSSGPSSPSEPKVDSCWPEDPPPTTTRASFLTSPFLSTAQLPLERKETWVYSNLRI